MSDAVEHAYRIFSPRQIDEGDELLVVEAPYEAELRSPTELIETLKIIARIAVGEFERGVSVSTSCFRGMWRTTGQDREVPVDINAGHRLPGTEAQRSTVALNVEASDPEIMAAAPEVRSLYRVHTWHRVYKIVKPKDHSVIDRLSFTSD